MITIGVDCGTQSLKALAWSPDGGVLGAASRRYGLIEGLPAGYKEQHPDTWVEALDACMAELGGQADLSGVVALAVSGQQHGMVALDADHRALRPALLWNDTRTRDQVDAILERAGGLEAYAAETGQFLPVGYTASKVLWLAQREPEHYDRLRHLLLPHDYLNLHLTGELAAEAGDASGTGYFDSRTRAWSARALSWIDPDRDLMTLLPPLRTSDAPIGTLRAGLARRWGLPDGVAVATGGGDNMMGAIGTGNVTEGVVTLSLGTSGTVYAWRAAPALDPELEVSAFCDSTGAWLPLASTLSTTVATEMVRTGIMNADLGAFNAAVASVPPGADGLRMLTCLEGERTPDRPDASGALLGLRPATCTPAHMARAAMEGATLALRYCYEALRRTGVEADHLRLIGGGAKSSVWRQICADVFDLPVVCPALREGPAFGAALQAAWVHVGGAVADLVDRHVALDMASRAEPEAGAVEVYAEAYGEHRRGMEALFEGRRPSR